MQLMIDMKLYLLTTRTKDSFDCEDLFVVCVCCVFAVVFVYGCLCYADIQKGMRGIQNDDDEDDAAKSSRSEVCN
jgi:hypothetical protein